VGYFIFFTELFFVSSNWLFGLLSLPIILSLMFLRLPYEEKLLEERFPNDYVHYKTDTPRFIPKIFLKFK